MSITPRGFDASYDYIIIGAGSAEGSLDAANILKPALSRGEIRCIGATTPAEYRKYIEKDRSLERRFQAIKVDPPSERETIDVLMGVKDRYEEFHHVEYTQEAIEAAVYQSSRYITDRFLPDKAIDLVDEAGARAKLREAGYSEEFGEINRNIRVAVEQMEARHGDYGRQDVQDPVPRLTVRSAQDPGDLEQDRRAGDQGDLPCCGATQQHRRLLVVSLIVAGEEPQEHVGIHEDGAHGWGPAEWATAACPSALASFSGGKALPRKPSSSRRLPAGLITMAPCAIPTITRSCALIPSCRRNSAGSVICPLDDTVDMGIASYLRLIRFTQYHQ